uniref:Receptor expression-enhancing protein n=1 Tax=Haptolina brevifila TaxID=156173 RepID=A0A7S2CEA2_9EUKA
MWLLSEALVLFVGQLYPAHASFKALHSKEADNIKKWVTYWAIFALWQQTFAIGEFFMMGTFFPFWYLIKCVSLILLVREDAAMAETVYRQLLPTFNDVEPAVELAFQQSRELIKTKFEALKTTTSEAVASGKAAAADAQATTASMPSSHKRDAPEAD